MAFDHPENPNQEADMIALLDEKALYDKLMPTIRAMAYAGGGADAILKRAEPIAATTLVSLLGAEKEETRRQVAKDIMERASGKAVERSMHMFGDISKMHDKDLDTQIKLLIDQTGAEALLAEVFKEAPKPKVGRPRGKKSKKNEIEIIDAE